VIAAPEWVRAWIALDTVAHAFSIPSMGEDPNATRLLTEAIISGDIPARLLGHNKVVSKAKWKSAIDENGWLPLRKMELSRTALHAWIKQHEPRIASGAKRGRKASWDWEECIMYVGKGIFDNGLPQKQATLEGWINEYFVNMRGSSPANSEIRNRAQKLWKLYKAGN
jgi:hypothetical protein